MVFDLDLKVKIMEEKKRVFSVEKLAVFFLLRIDMEIMNWLTR
jgi:hypothetical protein